MPCFTIKESSIHLGKVGNQQLLVKAFETLGYRGTVAITGGVLTFGTSSNGGRVNADGSVDLRGQATNLDVNTIKRAYSAEAVKLATKRFGWTLKTQSATKFVAARRY